MDKTIKFKTKPLKFVDARLEREINEQNLKKAPNLETGDWWDSPEEIKEIAKRLKKNEFKRS